jgi:hypothetical protein
VFGVQLIAEFDNNPRFDCAFDGLPLRNAASDSLALSIVLIATQDNLASFDREMKDQW